MSYLVVTMKVSNTNQKYAIISVYKHVLNKRTLAGICGTPFHYIIEQCGVPPHSCN